MARLPTPGSDGGTWGSILNEFLLQEHNPDGTLKIRSSGLTKAQVGLSNVDNTSDTDKPVSTAQQAAIDAKVANAITSGVTNVAPSQDAVFQALAAKADLSDIPSGGSGDTAALFAPRWQSALANAHSAQVSAIFVGSSTTAGSNATVSTNRYVDQLGNLLHKQFNAGAATGGRHVPLADTGWTTGGTVTTDVSDLSNYSRILNAGASLTRTIPNCTGFDVYFVQGPGSGSFTVTIDGGTPTTVTPDASGAAGRHDGTWTSTALTRGTHTLVITAVSTCNISSVYAQDSDATTGVRLYNSGRASTTASSFTSNTTMWQRAANLPNTALVVLMLGANDYASSVDPATFKANILTLINNAKSALTTQLPDFLLINTYKRLDVTPAHAYERYGEVMEELAEEQDRVYYMDLAGFYPTANDAANDPQNLIDTDNMHMTNAGHAYMARLIADRIAPDLGMQPFDVAQSQVVLQHSDGTLLPILPAYTSGSERGISVGGFKITSGRFDIDTPDNKVEFRTGGTNPEFNIFSSTHGQYLFRVLMSGGLVATTVIRGDLQMPTNKTIFASPNGVHVYNTPSDQTTNYERGRLYFASNVLTLSSENAGTGTLRDVEIKTPQRAFRIVNAGNSDGGFRFGLGSNVAGHVGAAMTGTLNATSGTSVALNVAPTIAGSSTQGYTAIQANVTETSTGSGTKRLLDLQVNGASKVSVRNDGVMMPVQAPTASAPAHVVGGIYFDTTLNKLRVGGASGWETVTSS
jgi:lysophospholipase L1-like esterase